MNKVETFHDSNGGEFYMVRFNSRLCSPTWRSKEPAQVYLNMLQKGLREPEYLH